MGGHCQQHRSFQSRCAESRPSQSSGTRSDFTLVRRSSFGPRSRHFAGIFTMDHAICRHSGPIMGCFIGIYRHHADLCMIACHGGRHHGDDLPPCIEPWRPGFEEPVGRCISACLMP